jgi:hypothetical protein
MGIEVPSDRAPRQIGLRVDEAGRRISELGRHANHRVALLCVQSQGSAAAAAEQMSTNAVSTLSPHLASYSAARPTVVGFMAVAFAVTLGLGVKTAI